MVQRSLMLLILVAVILVGGVSAASADLREIVMFVDGTSLAVQQLVVALSGSTVLHNLSLITALAVQTNDQGLAFLESKVQGMCNPLLDALCVVAGVYDDLGTLIDPICPVPALTPLGCSVECYPWGQQQINVPAARQQQPGLQGSGVTVAILDTGIDPTHSEFRGRIAPGYNSLTNGASSPYDDHGHGTHMAGIIAAALNNVGVIGTAPQATLAAVKVLDQNGVGYVSDVINGIQWIYNNGIRLVNMSFGFSSDSTPLRQAIETVYNGGMGMIMVASAGNRCAAGTKQEDGGGASCGPAATCTAPLTGVLYPAAYSWVIAVAATDSNKNVPDYSLAGPAVDVAASGGAYGPASGKILSTNTGGAYGVGYGTSQAAAHVTGAAALALQLKPGQSFNQVRSLLQTTAAVLPGYSQQQQGAGLIDAKKMILQLTRAP
jgi:subtilisin family serine protease